MTKNWKSQKDKRDAATAFLQKTIIDADVRSAVLKDRNAARRLFAKEGGISIPDDVEVICIGRSTQERDRLIVFVLPSEDADAEQVDPLAHWVAAWSPYGIDPVAVPPVRGDAKPGVTRNWKSKKDRREAATVFLQKTITDPDVRSAVLKDRNAAGRLFAAEGVIDIPDDVEVICVGPSTQERDRLIVFVLPSEDADVEQIDPLAHWIAAWSPYGLDPVALSLDRSDAEIEPLVLAASL